MTREPNPWQLFLVETGESTARLDSWLVSKLPLLSRRGAQAMILAGEVTVNGKMGKKGASLAPGDTVAVWSPPPQDNWHPMADPTVALSVIHEDDHLAVVDKPSGIASVPLSPNETGTLANGLVVRFPTCAEIGRSRGDAGLLQRLDRDTSGAVLVAKTPPVFSTLVAMQARDEIEKTYTALVLATRDELPETVSTPLSPTEKHGRKVKVDDNGIPAQTRVRLVRKHRDWWLVEATIHQGRRHQIRAHLASVGFPIAGDPLYGPQPSLAGLTRLFLHASTIRLTHPVSHRQAAFHSPLPPALTAALGEVSK